MPLFPNNREKDTPQTPERVRTLSLKSSFSSFKSKPDSERSPGKLVKSVKKSLRRIADQVTHRSHKNRAVSDSRSDKSLSAIVPLTTAPVIGAVGSGPASVLWTAPNNATKRQEVEPWEEQRDGHVARRSRSLSFISPFFPRKRTTSRSESASTTIEQSFSDSGTLASESLTQESQISEEKIKEKEGGTSIFDSAQHQLVVVEESTPEEEEPVLEEQQMDREQLEPSADAPFEDEEVANELIPAEESTSSHPPPEGVVTEPEVPDPFLVDEEGDALSEEEHQSTNGPSEPQGLLAHEISLSPLVASEPSNALPSLIVNKEVPSLPSAEGGKEEIPELSVPALIKPGMFLPIPNTDPLTTLLSKYIYPPEKRPVRDLTGDWQRSDFHTLVMTNSWRALAEMARDQLITMPPVNVTKILNLWYIRLASLARLRLFNQTSAECTNLFAVLNAIEPLEDRAWLFDNTLPFELQVMYARLKYWAGDHMGYLDALYALLHKCKCRARQASSEAANTAEGDSGVAIMWKERGVRICLIIGSQLIEMNDIPAATKLLEPLCEQPNKPLTADRKTEGVPNTSIPALRSALGRMYLQAGNLHMAARHFAAASKDPAIDPGTKEMNAALFACADGQWERATTTLRGLLDKDEENFVAVNNLAVALLGQGKVQEAITILEGALKASPSSVVVTEPFLFNLSTLYELRYAGAIEKKRELLIEVAKWSGDGLKTSCLKMPTT